MRDAMRSGCRETSVRLRTLSPLDLSRLVGPAEAQYGEQAIVLQVVGAQGAIACGSTVNDQDANDEDPAPRTVGVHFEWNDILGETGYRRQIDWDSTTYLTEDYEAEVGSVNTANSMSATSSQSAVNQAATFRILGHVGHAPGHGATPIAGDVVSNECAVTIAMPAND